MSIDFEAVKSNSCPIVSSGFRKSGWSRLSESSSQGLEYQALKNFPVSDFSLAPFQSLPSIAALARSERASIPAISSPYRVPIMSVIRENVFSNRNRVSFIDSVKTSKISFAEVLNKLFISVPLLWSCVNRIKQNL